MFENSKKKCLQGKKDDLKDLHSHDGKRSLSPRSTEYQSHDCSLWTLYTPLLALFLNILGCIMSSCLYAFQAMLHKGSWTVPEELRDISTVELVFTAVCVIEFSI